jgi:hypothetical protein
MWSCSVTAQHEPEAEVGNWKLGWRIVESRLLADYQKASTQFDTLLSQAQDLKVEYVVAGLEAKMEIGQDTLVDAILRQQSPAILEEACLRASLGEREPCTAYREEAISKPALQLELIKMRIDDQAARSNWQVELMEKYGVDSTTVSQESPMIVDELNRNKLKDIIKTYGFPTRAMVGREAMFGVFLIIQHADRDTAWQAAQLPRLEAAVTRGDLEPQHYAYLYDRVQLKRGKPQLYGTQFEKVDPINRMVEIAETEDQVNLDARRRAIGLMPIEMYKRLVFLSFK